MKATIKDIARIASVSTATVSRVINNVPDGVGPELRNRILEIIQEVGYRPNLLAKSIITKKSFTIGLMATDVMTPFLEQVFKGINECIRADGYNLILCNSDRDSDYVSQVETLIARGIDGIILIGFFREQSVQLTDVLGDIPVVVFDYIPKHKELMQINTNNRQLAYELTNTLIDAGHRRIGAITGPLRYDTVQERLKGYKRALKDRNITWDERIITEGSFSIESGYTSFGGLIGQSNISALFCFNDLMAYGVYEYCRENGIIIPRDLSVVGFDDLPYSRLLTPPLTTASQPRYRLGFEGAKLLLERINDTSILPQKKILSGKVIIRDSISNRSN